MTYSLAITGANAQNLLVGNTEQYTLSDANAQAGSNLNAMATNTQFLCKGPDGSQAFFTLDAERSTPSHPVLLAVKP